MGSAIYLTMRYVSLCLFLLFSPAAFSSPSLLSFQPSPSSYKHPANQALPQTHPPKPTGPLSTHPSTNKTNNSSLSLPLHGHTPTDLSTPISFAPLPRNVVIKRQPKIDYNKAAVCTRVYRPTTLITSLPRTGIQHCITHQKTPLHHQMSM